MSPTQRARRMARIRVGRAGPAAAAHPRVGRSEGRSIDHVQIALSRGTIALPWASRQALLERLAQLNSLRDVRKKFVDVGMSRPVRLTQQQKGALSEVIEVWGSREPGGLTDGLPDGIVELRNALGADLHDAGSSG